MKRIACLALFGIISAGNLFAQEAVPSAAPALDPKLVKEAFGMELAKMSGLHCQHYHAEYKTQVPVLDVKMTETWQDLLKKHVEKSEVKSSGPRSLEFSAPMEGVEGVVVILALRTDREGKVVNDLQIQVLKETKVNQGTLFVPKFVSTNALHHILKCNF